MSHLKDKKIELAEKMYNQNGKGGKGPKPLYTENGKGGKGSVPSYKMVSPGGKGSAMKYAQTSGGEGFRSSPKYKQADAKRKNPMIVGKVKPSQKGRASLESVQNNTDMYRAGNETNRA